MSTQSPHFAPVFPVPSVQFKGEDGVVYQVPSAALRSFAITNDQAIRVGPTTHGAETGPEETDAQFRGMDGVLYRIPRESLPKFAVDEDEAWSIAGVRDRGKMPQGQDTPAELHLLGGSERSITSASPVILARAVRLSVEAGLYDRLAELLERNEHRPCWPLPLIDGLREVCQAVARQNAIAGRPPDIRVVSLGDDLVRCSLSDISRLLRWALDNGAFAQCLDELGLYEPGLSITIPTSVANQMKIHFASRLQSASLTDRQGLLARTLIASQPSPSPSGVPSPVPSPSPSPDPFKPNRDATEDTGMLGVPR